MGHFDHVFPPTNIKNSYKTLTDKKGGTIDLQLWRLVPCSDAKCFIQGNGYDCGVFTIMKTNFLSENLDILSFNQSHIPTFRQKICLYISKEVIPCDVI